MKRPRKLFLVMSLLMCVSLLFLGPVVSVAAKSDNAKGAVKKPLYIHLPATPGPATGGWVILNTTASGKLIVNVHLDVDPSILLEPQSKVEAFVEVHNAITATINGTHSMFVNAQGKGNTHLELPLDEFHDDGLENPLGFIQAAVEVMICDTVHLTTGLRGLDLLEPLILVPLVRDDGGIQ